jgi:hypothetical protein
MYYIRTRLIGTIPPSYLACSSYNNGILWAGERGAGSGGARSLGFSEAALGIACAGSGLAPPVRAKRPRVVQALLFDIVYKNPSSLPPPRSQLFLLLPSRLTKLPFFLPSSLPMLQRVCLTSVLALPPCTSLLTYYINQTYACNQILVEYNSRPISSSYNRPNSSINWAGR